MIIPSGHTEEEVTATIMRVAQRLAHKYRFAYYDYDDIFQEAFIIGMEGLENYDPERPLENFMSVHISNRLKNLIRSKYTNETKRNLLEAITLDNVSDEAETNMWTQFDFMSDLQIREMFELIDNKLPVSLRANYLRMKAGLTISKNHKEKIENAIIDILAEASYENW